MTRENPKEREVQAPKGTQSTTNKTSEQKFRLLWVTCRLCNYGARKDAAMDVPDYM